ncbi:MAG: hypothetical protein ACXW0L_00520 [Methylosarcina sp.]
MRPKTSDELKRAVTLRAAGWTLAAIVLETGISASTLQRHFKAHGVGRGTLSAEAVEQAQRQLIEDGFFDSLKHQIAAAILDDLSLARQLRESALLTLEELTEDATTPPMIKSRSLAALATATKITSDILRRALRMDSGALDQVKELPTLVITKMTEEECREIRESLEREEY